MNKRFFPLLAVLAFMLLGTVAGFAQMVNVQGAVKDTTGAPVVGAQVVWHNSDNNHDYKLKTNKKGEYQGILPIGTYDVKTYRAEDLNTPVHKIDKFALATSQDPFQTYDITVPPPGGSGSTSTSTNPAAATPTPPPLTDKQLKQLSPEEKQKLEEVKKKNEEINKENVKIKDLNNLMNDARAAMKATPPDNDKAVTLMTQATTEGPNYDAPWGVLGEAQLAAGHYQEAADAFQKAIQLNVASPKPNLEWQAAWNHNLGKADVKLNKIPDAVAAYETAAKDQPAQAPKFYYNEGVELTNLGQLDPAIAAFNKSIAASDKPAAGDTTLANAYFQKGVLLVGKATMQGGKLVAPPGTEEALNKYLELAPNGPNAATAEELLKQLGAKITTTYKKK